MREHGRCRARGLFGLSCVALCIIAVTGVACRSKPKPVKVLLVGDSAARNYAPYLITELSADKKFQVECAPTPDAATSATLISHVFEWIIRPQPDVMVLNAGRYDISRDNPGHICETHGEIYAEVIRELFVLIHAHVPHARVIWVSTLPTDEDILHGKENQDIIAYNKLAAAAAADTGVEVLDLHGIYYPRRHGLTVDGTRMKPEISEEIAHYVAQRIQHTER